jgi:hypothetical protein
MEDGCGVRSPSGAGWATLPMHGVWAGKWRVSVAADTQRLSLIKCKTCDP